MSETTSGIPRGTGLLIIEVRNSNPNGDPDRESDPRQRSHDGRGYISGVSFKRKLRDLVEQKDGEVWTHNKTRFALQDDSYCVLESRQRGFPDVEEASEGWRRVVALIGQGDADGE
jgi:CRISPR-associated protein Csd2